MMSDVENAERCNMPNLPSKPTEKFDQNESFIGSPENIDPKISEDGKPFVGMEGELDFEVLSPVCEEQFFSQPPKNEKEVDSLCKTGESKKVGEEGPLPFTTIAEKGNESKANLMEDGEDDGECSDDDLEEGEVKDENEMFVTKARQVCRFFNRGMCFYGIQCRFLHLNNDMKGNYNMFSPTPPRYEPAHIGNMMVPPGQGIILHRSAPRSGPDFMPVVPPLLPASNDEESAWEKGLREAKTLLQKANQRKEEPDFEVKRLTLSLSSAFDRNTQIKNEKENDKFGYKKKNREDLYKYGDPAPRTHYVSRYENFEIRYTDVDRGGGQHMRSRRRTHVDRRFHQREDTGHSLSKNGDRMEDMEKIRAEAYFDPWRRSKSPKHRRSKDRERSRSFGGSPFSSVSSYSSRSSSLSYSRSSSSMSRGLSSRSPSPVSDKKKKNPANKNLYPLSPKEPPNKVNVVNKKKKPGARTRNPRTRSYSRSRSRQVFSHSSSSRSRSQERGSSVYSSRSSRSLSMDSVSSASNSSSGESSGHPEHVSILRRQDEKPTGEKPEVLPPAGGSFYFQILRPNKNEKLETDNIGLPDNDRDPLEESFQMSQVDTSTFPAGMQHLMATERAKDPVKGLHPPKQQIKLTLLNKNPQSKLSNLPKKELEGIKEEIPKVGFLHGLKRPLSPPVPPAVAKPQPAIPKKSASSRRDELLKQLKAVEDAIARKRAKFC